MRSEQSQVQTGSELYDLLASLGDAPDQVALSLLEGGFQGRRNSAYRCPVACFLKERTGSKDVEVDHELVAAFQLWPHIISGLAQPPEAVSEFIQRFDKGDWPELVEVMP